MMNQIDAYILARTKLKSHKVRTGITIGVAGILFGLIIALLTVINGVFASIDSYSKIGLNDRTIIGVSYYPQAQSFNEYEHSDDTEFVDQVEKAYKAESARKEAIAKKHNFEYDSSVSDPSPIGTDPITKQKIITNDGLSSPVVQKLANQRRAELDKKFSISEYLAPYKSVTMRGSLDTVQPTDGSLLYMKNGKENQQVSSNRVQESMIASGGGANLAVLNESITQSFITNKDFDVSKGEIPVILPVGDAQKLLQLTPLDKDASAEQQRERLQYVRAHIHEATASFCYRNNASRALLGTAVAQQDELKRAVGNSSYVAPSLLYEAPDTNNCSAVTIKSDKRTAEEKRIDANRIAFEKEAGIYQGDPMQYKVTVRGVGVSGDSGTGSSASNMSMFINGLLNSSLGYNTWTIPSDLLAQLPTASVPKEVFDPEVDTNTSWMPPEPYLAEFSNKEEARALLERTGAFNGSFGDVSAYQFASSTLLIDEARSWVETGLFWVLLAVGGIAVIILWGIIGRTVADSRRESAVFRAIGATKLDIANIYGLYTLLLSLRVVVFALVLGLGLAFVTNMILGDAATLGAQLAYAAVDSNIQFNFFSPLTPYVGIVIAAIVVAGIVSSIIPISMGARRSPIADMRDDS